MTLQDRVTKLFDLRGRSALVTGATGALGSAAARALAGAGAHVCLAGGNEAGLRELHSALLGEGGNASIVVGRHASEAEAQHLASGASAGERGLDILVVAAGTSVVKPALDLSATEWDSVMNANARQSWLMAREAARLMIAQQRGGKIVLVSSVRATHASPAGTSAYGASKAAVDMMTRSFALEWAKHRINVNAIAPTVFRSDLTSWMFEPAAEQRRNATLSRIPLGRLAEPDDFAGTLVYLCAAASDYMTGEILNVDGGFNAG